MPVLKGSCNTMSHPKIQNRSIGCLTHTCSSKPNFKDGGDGSMDKALAGQACSSSLQKSQTIQTRIAAHL